MQDEMNDLQEVYTDPNPEDLVRVVRCKDCRWRRKHRMFCLEYLQCERSGLSEYHVVEPSDYCSYGERKDG